MASGIHWVWQKDTPLFLFAHFVFWWIFKDESVQLMARVNFRDCTACFAFKSQILLLDLYLCLWISTTVALYILLDEAFQDFRQLLVVMSPIDNASATLSFIVCLSTKLTSIVL